MTHSVINKLEWTFLDQTLVKGDKIKVALVIMLVTVDAWVHL